MIKVAHITNVDLSLRYLLLNQLKTIEAAGYKVVGVSNHGKDVSYLKEQGIEHRAVRMTRNFTPLKDLISLFELYRLFRREKFDIVHTHTPKPGLIGQLAARLAGVPIVVNTLHGFYFHDETPARARRFYIWMEKIAALCSDVILSQNKEDIQTALAEKIARDAQIKLLGNGIDIQRFDPKNVAAAAVEKIRAEFNLTNDMIVVGFVGRLVREKGLIELLQAAKIAAEEHPNLRLLIIGPLDQVKEDAFQPAHAAEYGVENICIFTGMRNDMPELFSVMDMFVLPSHREGFPRSPMEASAMSVPSIVTDIRGCRETVIHEHNGLLVPLKKPVKLAEAFIRLIDDQALYQQLVKNCRPFAEENFDEKRVFQIVIDEYDRLITQKGF